MGVTRTRNRDTRRQICFQINLRYSGEDNKKKKKGKSCSFEELKDGG